MCAAIEYGRPGPTPRDRVHGERSLLHGQHAAGLGGIALHQPLGKLREAHGGGLLARLRLHTGILVGVRDLGGRTSQIP